MESKLIKRLVESARINEKRNCISYKGLYFTHRYTYGRILDFAKRFSSLLVGEGVQKGDMLIISSPNCPQYIYAMLGAMLNGVIVVPIDFSFSPEFLDTIATETKAKLVLTSRAKILDFKKGATVGRILHVEELDELLEEVAPRTDFADVSDDDLLSIMYTSGTTSKPKGVMLTHGNIHANIDGIERMIALDHGCTFLSILPLSHTFEQMGGFYMPFAHGSHVVHLGSRRGSIIRDAMASEKTTHIATVPAFMTLLMNGIKAKAKSAGKLETLNAMMKKTKNLSSGAKRLVFGSVLKNFGNLQVFFSGGAPLPRETEEFWNALGVRVLQGYGLTECSPVVTGSEKGKSKVGSAGVALYNVGMRIVEENEIQVRGPSITQGYYKNEDATRALFAPDGWMRTGDHGCIDEDGFLFIKGRLKNMILKEDGMNIYPEDMEPVIEGHPAVKKCCVVGLETGSHVSVCAAVIAEKGASPDEIMKWSNAKLEAHQRIQKVVLWPTDAFPMTHTLKVKRDEVVSGLSAGKDAQGPAQAADADIDPLIKILAELVDADPKTVVDEMFLFDDLGLDSLGVIELADKIEEFLKVEIDESQIKADTRVSDLRRFVSEKKSERKRLPFLKWAFSPIFIPLRIAFQELSYGLLSLFYRIRVEGRENLKGFNEICFVTPNHESHLDSLCVTRNLPMKIRNKMAVAAAADHFFVRKNMFDFRLLWGPLVAIYFNAIPMSREGNAKESMRIAGKVMDHGYSIMVFPEGTRGEKKGFKPFKKGIGLMVADAKKPVVPVRIRGFYDILPKKAIFPRKFGSKLSISYGKPIRFKSTDSPAYITDKIEEAIRAM